MYCKAEGQETLTLHMSHALLPTLHGPLTHESQCTAHMHHTVVLYSPLGHTADVQQTVLHSARALALATHMGGHHGQPAW